MVQSLLIAVRMARLSRGPCVGAWERVKGLSTRHSALCAPQGTVEMRETGAAGAEDPSSPFSRSLIGTFFQDQPLLGNQLLEDALLQGYLRRHLPPEVLGEVCSDLERFSERLCSEIQALGRQCEETPPQLQHYDPWGRRVDRIITCPAWGRMKEISAEEGLVAAGYERTYGQWSRVYQVSKLYLYCPSAGLFSCPLAMTDGAAKIIESIGVSGLLEKPFRQLTSRDPKRFWTSGQWMTERKGGSDVASGTETVAKPQPDGTYRLYGFKWFTSATDSDMTLTLARVVDKHGQTLQGSKGLSLFYVEVRDEQGNLNNIEVQRLKDKLGTRQVPTAELLLDGVRAQRISEEGRGVASIANMLTITRIHNVISAVGCMRRIINLGREYATKRFVFGKFLKEHPLHMQTMARMEVETRAAFLLLMELSRLLGREETGCASELELHMLRLLTPVAKLYTGKQVLSIWEGTTNILSLDVLRSLAKSRGRVLEAFFTDVKRKLEAASVRPALTPAMKAVESSLHRLGQFAQVSSERGPDFMQLSARDFAYSLARIYMGTLLVDHAAWEGASQSDLCAALRWCEQDLCPVVTKEKTGCYSRDSSAMDTALVYEGSPVVRGRL